ncbi:hypothetical protein GDO86_007551 [Hymenochirus boettgeri]|uniref:Uncharacterized protein n=1 Tax=Hymenochirus boettgeri TaxID=247094 RepID=A0A8T2IZE3_9PIPI|nr:hypothetical protein GDO86_007551 [Hymenochirus boettgeri]
MSFTFIRVMGNFLHFLHNIVYAVQKNKKMTVPLSKALIQRWVRLYVAYIFDLRFCFSLKINFKIPSDSSLVRFFVCFFCEQIFAPGFKKLVYHKIKNYYDGQH